jgi:mannose-1-phosphate guanylyltransferase
MLHAVIMAGGSGTRFWPASRAANPKQLLNLVGDRSMIQATVDRLQGLVPGERILIVTNEALTAAIADQLPEVPREAILGEPCKRDTAPCIGLAAGILKNRDPDAVLVVMPADHVIQPDDAFQSAIRAAAKLVEENPQRLVTFGIKPTYPASTYGYIERGESIPTSGGPPAFQVRKFREKPSVETAEEFLQAGGFYWNAGIFIWKADTILAALRKYEPEMAKHVESIAATAGSEKFAATFRDEFTAIKGKSIDYAVLEQHPEVVVVEAPFAWDDVGNWQSLSRTRGTDADGNTLLGRHLALDTKGSIVSTDKQHLVVTVGLKDCIVVHTPNATLVANKNDEEALRDVVAKLKELGWKEYL